MADGASEWPTGVVEDPIPFEVPTEFAVDGPSSPALAAIGALARSSGESVLSLFTLGLLGKDPVSQARELEVIYPGITDLTQAAQTISDLAAFAAGGAGFLRGFGREAAKQAVKEGGTETVQRWMSRAELEATQKSGLLRGGSEGTHFVTDAANATAQRARQRLALPQTPEVRVTLEVPSGTFSPPSRVQPAFNMPGGGMERTATGDVPVRILNVGGGGS